MASTQTYTYIDGAKVLQTPGAGDNYGGVSARFPGADYRWGDGTSGGEADTYYESIAQVIGASADVDLDLDALANGPSGGTVSFAEVRAIHLAVIAGGGFLGGIPTNAWTALLETAGDRLVLGVGRYSFVAPTDGLYPVGASDKVLRITSGGSGMTLHLLIVGTTA